MAKAAIPTGWSRKALALHLYEVSVTNATKLARFSQALAPKAHVLREDFAGSGSLARGWADLSPKHSAAAVEKDADVASYIGVHPRVKAVIADATRCTQQAEIIAATNFPLGYFHTRSELLKYLSHAKKCLTKGGVFFADMYGGDGCFTPQVQKRTLRNDIVGRFTYEWEQLAANEATRMVQNRMHFQLASLRLENAFSYHWRLWALPELRDCMLEAGFKKVAIYDRLADAVDDEGNVWVEPVKDDEGLDATWVVYVVAR